ncbi:dolichol kinase [Gurleya vavrai]
MFETDFIKIIKKILIDTYFNQLIFLKLLIIVFLCLACQYVFFKKTSNNSKRKIYHIYIFFIFYNCNIYVIHCSSILIYFLLFVSTHWNGKLIFKNFINKKDKGKYVLSHIFILAGCTFPYFFLTQEQYTATLISICLQDAAASFAGKFLRSNTKTLFGLITGFIVANITYFLLNHKINQKNFFAVIGLIEYLTESNDNLVIPFFAVLYFKIQNLIFESNQY